MNDLRKAAEMALEALNSKYIVNCGAWMLQQDQAAEVLRQALDDKPAVKSYCGGKANYCTPEVTPEVTPYVDAVNMTQDRVDEKAKSEHEPECVATIGNWGKVEWRHDVYPQLGDKLYTAPPKREWVGLTHEERFLNDCRSPEEIEYAIAIEAKLKEKNNG